jgi:hypothetical protein
MTGNSLVFACFASLSAVVGVSAQPPIPQPPVQGPINVPAYPTTPVQIVPAPVPAPVPTPGVPVIPVLPAATPLSLAQAERALRCLPPGCHHLLLIHPVTCCPVAVTVRISGCVTDVKAGKFFGTHKLTFKVKGHNNDVVIKFKPNGTVVVND